MRLAFVHLIVCAIAAAAPLAAARSAPSFAQAAPDAVFPGWPESFEGHRLVPLPAQPDDARFVEEGGGARVARFRAGETTVLVRWSPRPTRSLHPSSRCFQASGWCVTPAPRVRDAQGRAWTCYVIERDGRRLRVRERVEDAAGRSWADPMDWYWAGLLGDASGPAFAFTVTTTDR